MILETKCGQIKGNERDNSYEFLGIRYASAGRFEYAALTETFDGIFDATLNGDSCVQIRAYYEHLENPERRFYHHEFREGIVFNYSEDCLRLNIWTPKKEGKYPVVVFIHGGGFDSGSISESPFDGDRLSSRGLVVVTIQYRVGVLGYLTNETLASRNGHDGNFGLDDQYKALLWIKKNISDYFGDCDNVTVMGQSAGAISIQYMLLSERFEGLFGRAVMMSGAGLFPKFSLPRKPEETREYWNEVISLAGCRDIDEFSKVDTKTLFDAIEKQKALRNDGVYNTMPVIDGYYLSDSIDRLIKHPRKIDTIIGFTNRDMYAALMAYIGISYASKNGSYVYYFDIDAKGDENKAFHSSDLRYIFGTLEGSWRPYEESDRVVSDMMMDYIAAFALCGNPNFASLPEWTKERGKVLVIREEKTAMGKVSWRTLLKNTLTGSPKYEK